MFPPPTTIATSTPVDCTSTISAASASIVGRSIPNSRSPMSASPETLSRMRLNTGASAPARAGLVLGTVIRRARSARTRAPRRLRRRAPASPSSPCRGSTVARSAPGLRRSACSASLRRSSPVPAREALVAAADLHEHAELVRGWMDVALDDAAVDGLEAGAARHDDVLAELADELLAFLFQLFDRIDPP